MFCLILLVLFFSRRWYWHAPYYNAWSHPYGYGYYPYGAYSYYNPYWRQGYGAGYGYGPYGGQYGGPW